MSNQEKNNEIENLSEILSTIRNLYHKKNEQLEELHVEISVIKEVLNKLNLIVSNKSFHSADEIYLQNLDKDQIDNYFKEEISQEKTKGTKLKRKIFSKDEQELLCILNFKDFNTIEVKLINPELRAIKESSEKYINIFLKGALFEIIDKNPDLTLSYEYFKNTDTIEIIKISNLKSLSEYDLITDSITELVKN